jgi:hypothetical protein
MGTDIHVFMERQHKGQWVPVRPPEYTGPKDTSQVGQIDWEHFGRWAEPVSPMEQLAHAVLPIEDRIPSVAEQWNVARDYRLFANLANVRASYNVPVFDEPRDLPKDVSPAVAHGIDGYHSISWWQLDELDSHRHAFPDDDEDISSRVDMLIAAMRTIANDYNLDEDQVRMVFGFDS